MGGAAFRPALLLILAALPVSAQVVPDGSTATTVTVAPDGRVTVGVAAPGRNGISRNSYDRFSVPSAGVDLDNRTAAARTILNEVTGTAPSRLEGPLTVLGQRAHVIVANPNGIVIDGGRFVNTGRVGLTTGQAGLADQQIAPGIFQSNVTARVTGGTITIEGGGLSGQMDAVDLIAERIRVNGAISAEGAEAALTLRAGHGVTEFDSSIVPGNTSLGWSRGTALAGGTEGVMVEILSPGVLNAYRIGIEVTGAGAGVRHAGSAVAGAHGFSVRADGMVEVDGGRVTSAGSVSVNGGGVRLRGAEVTATSGGVQITGTASALVSGGTIDALAIGTSMGAVLSFDAEGATRARLRGAPDLSLTGGTLRLLGADVTAEGSVQLEAEGLELVDGSLRAAGHLVGTVGAMTVRSVARQADVVAENGSLVLSGGSFTNAGGLIQGGQRIDGVAAPDGSGVEGAVTLSFTGDLRHGSTADHLGLIFGAAGDAVLRAGGDLEVRQARVLANGAVTLAAAGDVGVLTADAAPVAVQTVRRSRGLLFFLPKRRVTTLTYAADPVAADRTAIVTALTGVTVTAGGTIRNHGGEINANGGDIALTAAAVDNRTHAVGHVAMTMTCGRSCRSAGTSELAFLPARIAATGHVTVTADLLDNAGGEVLSLADLTVTAARVRLASVQDPLVVSRPGGLYNLWSGASSWIILRDRFGGLLADAGRLVIRSLTPVEMEGGYVSARDGTEMTAGEATGRAVGGIRPGGGDAPLGMLARVPAIGR
ncbi:hypothetical protein GCM10011360_41760 [Primorskyibacter flagellatus]|uniref:Filamentous haemagglutinin FhaB/tRNA nuclease CdiA-like TPS domain-containing protein n=1 Tax=Primorskyibacter flagellatus TaxID=1387277 RepID=A0A917EIV8_9RHOB|nr:filamentous hemagglutinin N-terminal domain-containing protein [Primorskyibacter flagellatus]GGE50340.1 hypothetical protein GCM10011360_41760 [Primorskyibacter flagellatus]